MKKLRMKSVDLVQSNIEKIAELFPHVITEVQDEHGILKRAVDFDLLKQELSYMLVEGEKERYQLTWPGKKQAILLAKTPIDKTLRPVKEESVNWDKTKNLYIEGDNLEVLKLLQESYLNKIKCIYIDPPYNTGKDFIYKDNYQQTLGDYFYESGQFDLNGNRLVKNVETNGRFHSDWLTMMYPRLKIARSLLRDDGFLFVSIDDHELDNLKKMCDEIFGSENFIANVIWQHSIQPKGYLGKFSVHHNYVLIYAKSLESDLGSLQRTAEHNKAYSNPDNDPRGPWRPGDVRNALYRPNLIFDIVTPSGKIIKPPANGWRWSKETIEQKIKMGEIIFSDDESKIIRKIYLNDLKGRAPETIWFGKEVGTTRDAKKCMKELFDNTVPFDTPKPVGLIKRILEISTDQESEDIVLDFFSGSATTAHAVMQLNAEDGGMRRYIMVQLPEPTPDDSEAYKAGYKNICEIGKERIRRAAKKIKEETGADIDYGFRVFCVDSSNMKDVYYTPDKLKQGELFGQTSNIKEDRTSEDLLIQVMLELGLELSLPMETKNIEGKTVHYVDGNALVACFDENVPESVIRKIAKDQPLKAVFRDSSFADDSARINVEELFKMISPITDVRVL